MQTKFIVWSGVTIMYPELLQDFPNHYIKEFSPLPDVLKSLKSSCMIKDPLIIHISVRALIWSNWSVHRHIYHFGSGFCHN